MSRRFPVVLALVIGLMLVIGGLGVAIHHGSHRLAPQGQTAASGPTTTPTAEPPSTTAVVPPLPLTRGEPPPAAVTPPASVAPVTPTAPATGPATGPVTGTTTATSAPRSTRGELAFSGGHSHQLLAVVLLLVSLMLAYLGKGRRPRQ
jgi:hypothetical protein